jgi:hypothetical protein
MTYNVLVIITQKKEFVTEVIEGVKVEYVSEFKDKPLPAGCGIIMLPMKVNGVPTPDREPMLRGYGKLAAAQAAADGYKRVQIGSMGDMSYYGFTKGPFIALDTMFVARLLKR